MNEWQPIETASKEQMDGCASGHDVLLYFPEALELDRIRIGFWYGSSAMSDEEDENNWFVVGEDDGPAFKIYGEPTHWMPIPMPPAT